MPYLNFLDSIGTVGNKETCLKIIKEKARDGRIRNLNDRQLAMEVNGNRNKDEDRFFSRSYLEYDVDESRVFYLWVNTKIKDKTYGDDIYVQFAKGRGEWQGGHVGTEKDIIDEYMKKTDPSKITKDLRNNSEGLFGTKGNIFDDITISVFDRESGAEAKAKAEAELKAKALEAKAKKDAEAKAKAEEQAKKDAEELAIKKAKEEKERLEAEKIAKAVEEALKKKEEELKAKAEIATTTAPTTNNSISSPTPKANTRDVFEGMEADEIKFFNDLYDKLLVKKGWELENGNLISYIKLLATRINNCIGTGKEEYNKYLIFNKDKTYVLFNSAFLDNFGNNIMIVNQLFPTKKNEKPRLSYNRFYLAESKTALSSLGFSKSDIASYPTRIPFYNEDVSELIFTGDIDDVDTENYDRLTHCIIERKGRFPEFCANWTDKMHYDDLVEAIEFGIKLSKYDSGYIKPIYNPKYDRIQYIIPYHVKNNFQNQCELGIVITKENDGEYWQVMTILEYEQCIKDIKILSLYTENSFI